MTIIEELEAGDKWEAERKRRLAYQRSKAWREALRKSRLEVSVMMALLVGFLAFMLVWNGCVAPMMERTASLEGDGYDHETALALARQGYGKTAEEMLKEAR